jgi:16S rRNA (adenine1518-N6/adenine1519-N6)-dimethyltransferase
MTSPKHLLSVWRLQPKKSLGQNFLSDPNIAEKILSRAGIKPDDTVIEIGPGLGALTIPVARMAKKVVAIENDKHMCNLLKTQLQSNHVANVHIIHANILKTDIAAVCDTSAPCIVIGNLPYYISSQILVKLIRERNVIRRALLMFQKEMAKRIESAPGCKDYGRLAVMVQYCSNIKRVLDVKADLFYPKPNIDSRVIEVCFKTTIDFPAENETLFFKVIKGAFSKRRKILKNSLSGDELDIDSQTAEMILEKAGIDALRRAETLSVKEFVTLSNTFSAFFKSDTLFS